jgi:hypothetical protein
MYGDKFTSLPFTSYQGDNTGAITPRLHLKLTVPSFHHRLRSCSLAEGECVHTHICTQNAYVYFYSLPIATSLQKH